MPSPMVNRRASQPDVPECTREPVVWQIEFQSAGRAGHPFLRHGVALLGPGDAGPWSRDRYDCDYHRAIGLLAETVRLGDILLAREFPDTIRAAGVVVSDYVHLPQFAHLGDGRQHARRVRWLEMPGGGRCFPDAFRLSPPQLSRLDDIDREAERASAVASRSSPPTASEPHQDEFAGLAESVLGLTLAVAPIRAQPRLPPGLPDPDRAATRNAGIVALTRALAAHYGGSDPRRSLPDLGDFLTNLLFPALRQLGWPAEPTRLAAGVALEFIRVRLGPATFGGLLEEIDRFFEAEAVAVRRREVVRYARELLARAPAGWTRRKLPPLPPEESDLDAAPKDLADVVALVRERSACYRHSRITGEAPEREELLVHLVIPVLRRLGWSPDRIGVSAWDLRLYSGLPRSPENGRFGIYLHELGAGPTWTTRNGRPQAFAHCPDIVTDGVHYRFYDPHSGRAAAPALYADLSRPTRSSAELIARLRAPGGRA